jgi:hypothetical protein
MADGDAVYASVLGITPDDSPHSRALASERLRGAHYDSPAYGCAPGDHHRPAMTSSSFKGTLTLPLSHTGRWRPGHEGAT